MTDIFISYSRNDRERVRHMAQALEADGFNVWWDPEILPGESFSKVIDKKLKDASCIIAVWSESSINSNWVQEEADDGMQRNTLIPVMIDEIDLPRGFKRLQTADLRGWEGDTTDPNWQMILTQVRKLVSNRAAAEAAEQQAAARAQQAKVQAEAAQKRPAPTPTAAPQAHAPAQEKKSGGLPVLLLVAALALVGVAFSGYLLMSSGDDEKSASAGVSASSGTGTENTPTIAASSAEENDTSAEELNRIALNDDQAVDIDGADEVALEADSTVDDVISERADSDSDVAEISEEAVESQDEDTPEVNETESVALTDYTPGEAFRDCDQCPEVMPFAGGAEFTMGAPDGEFGRDEAETPQIDVMIAKPFAIGVYEVTYDDWAACLADGGCGDYQPSDVGWGGGNRPLVNVSVEDAKNYLTWLSEKTGANYRLPSEAEWEYAARAGKADPFHTGDLITAGQANFNGQYPYNNAPKGQYRSRTTPVGAFAANAFGLHDMHGNVWEWTEDCWRNSHSGAPKDGSPVGGSCSSRVVKGGAWNAGAWRLRSAFRKAGENNLRKFDTGFRVARDL